MRNRFVIEVKNVGRFSEMVEALLSQKASVPAMGAAIGFTGAGKTDTTIWLSNEFNAIHLRASALWTPSGMMRALTKELGLTPKHGAMRMMEAAVDALAANGKPLLVDEADLIPKDSLLEVLRELHDVAHIPVVLIGTEALKGRVQAIGPLSRRISHWMHFNPISIEDARFVADARCELDGEVSDDLLMKLHDQANGSIGKIVVGLEQIEKLCGQKRWTSISLKQWEQGGQPFFFDRAA